jgi:hypothetical protein
VRKAEYYNGGHGVIAPGDIAAGNGKPPKPGLRSGSTRTRSLSLDLDNRNPLPLRSSATRNRRRGPAAERPARSGP